MKFNQEVPPVNKKEPTLDDFKEMLDKDSFNLEAFKTYGYGEDLTAKGALELSKQIDLTNNAKFRDSYTNILILQDFFMEHGEYVKKSDDFMRKIKEKLNNTENNYFLNKFFEETINGKIYAIDHDQSITPFLIQKDQYAILSARDEILLAPKGEKTCKEIKQMIKRLDREAEKASKDWGYDSDSINIQWELESMFDIKLKAKDFLLNETNDRNLPTIDDYAKIVGSGFKSIFEKDFGIKITDLSIPEQFQFLKYLMNIKVKESKRVVDFAKKFKRNAFRTFLSIEQGGKDMGDKILTLAEKLPEEVAKKLFAKYAEYIDNVDNVENFVEGELIGKKAKPETVQKIKETLLLKGRDILVSQYEKVIGSDFDLDKFEEFINNAKADVDLFKNTFKTTLEENPETSFEDFMNLQANTKTSLELTEKTKEEIKNMIKRNYKDTDLQNAVLSSFEKSLENPNTKISTLEREGKTIASDRLDFDKDGSIYFGTFNVDPDYCSAKIGNAFFKSTVAPYLKEHIVRADCSVRQPISAYYIESGFVGTNFYDYKGEPSLSIESMPGKNFESKKLSKEEIVVKLDSGNSQFLIKSFTKQEEIANENIDGKFLTRFFYDSKSNRWIALWE